MLKFSLRRKERLVTQLEARLERQRESRRALAEDWSVQLASLVLLVCSFASLVLASFVLIGFYVLSLTRFSGVQLR